MKKTLIILISIIILNCGGGTTNNEVTAITIGSLGNEMKYDTTEFTVNAGATVKLTMKNNASMENMIHNIVILLDESAAPNIVKYADSNVNAYNNNTANVYADTNTPPQQLGETMVLP